MPALIDIQHCSLMRGDQLALEDLSLRIEQGQSVAILGPNGSGKSSLLKLFTRELYPLDRDNSRLSILGQEHFDIRSYRRHLGILSLDLQKGYDGNVPGLEVVISGFFDSVSLWHHFDIEERQISRALTVMEKVQISNMRDRRFDQMSTGQQRRVLLARALVHDPDTLILDEPTTGLDMRASFQFTETLRSLMKAGKSIILVTHQLQEIPPEITRVIFLQNGRIIGDGEKAEMLTDQNLSNLFQTAVSVSQSRGYYQASPK